MADISKVITLDGSEYDIKDATARAAIAGITNTEASFVNTALVITSGSGGGGGGESLPNAEEVSF